MWLQRYPLSTSQTSSGICTLNMWETGDLPSIWKLANVIPISKPGKDHSKSSNYRPIALTSCVCKTMKGWSMFALYGSLNPMDSYPIYSVNSVNVEEL